MNRPRVYCDFNHGIDEHTFGLVKLGTQVDLARLQLTLTEGLEVTLYNYDTDGDGASAWLEADAVVVHVPEVGWAARIEPSGFRNTPRHCHSARIHWTELQQTLGLPTVSHVVHPAWFDEDATAEGWSLACDFAQIPSEQGTPSLGVVEFVAVDAPHHALKRGATVRWFEPATGQRCLVEIED